MSNRKITFVVGAGASAEKNLPTGNELKTNIARTLKSRIVENDKIQVDQTIREAVNTYAALDGSGTNASQLFNAGNDIAISMPNARSIDHFIRSRQGDRDIEFMAKLGIAHEITSAERDNFNLLNPERPMDPPNFKNFEGTWYVRLMQLITSNCTINEITERLTMFSFVVFNYDRCIEHYLYHALKEHYRISSETAAELVNQLEIYHPYGTVGRLPWQTDYGSHAIDFGGMNRTGDLLNAVKGIKTFAEGTNPDEIEISKTRDAMVETEMIVFLGFSYQIMNLDLLSPLPKSGRRRFENPNTSIYGTAAGMSHSNCERIRHDLFVRLPTQQPNIYIDDNAKCWEFFDRYDRSIAQVID